MTYSQVYLNGKACLAKAGIESPAFDAMCIFESVFNMGRQGLAIRGEEDAPNGDIVTFNDKIGVQSVLCNIFWGSGRFST